MNQDQHLGQVAVKVVRSASKAFGDKERRRLEREVVAMKRARHEHVVGLHEHFFADDGRMLVMVCEFLSAHARGG